MASRFCDRQVLVWSANIGCWPPSLSPRCGTDTGFVTYGRRQTLTLPPTEELCLFNTKSAVFHKFLCCDKNAMISWHKNVCKNVCLITVAVTKVMVISSMNSGGLWKHTEMFCFYCINSMCNSRAFFTLLACFRLESRLRQHRFACKFWCKPVATCTVISGKLSRFMAVICSCDRFQ